jgi:anti-sigma factor RsiW
MTPKEHVLEALPEYVNGSLNAQESGEVKSHLEGCPPCRTELLRWQEVASATRSGPVFTPSAADWSGMLEQIDRAGGRARKPGFWELLRSWFDLTPAPMRWAFAAQGALVVVLGASLLFGPGSGKVYETLSSPEQVAPSGRARLHVVFAEDATEREIRAALEEMKAAIVGGPSPTGVYTVELPFAASERRRIEETVARVAANPKVRFAAAAGGP